MTEQSQTSRQEKPSFLNVLGTVIKLTLTVLFAVGLGAGLYYGVSYLVPKLRARYIQPVEDNARRLTSLEAKNEQQESRFQEAFDDLTNRVNTLEIRQDDSKNQRGALQETLQATLDALSTEISAQQATQQVLQENYSQIQERLSSLETQVAEKDRVITYLATAQVPARQIERENQLLLIMNFINQAKISLLHENYGLAEEDLREAQSLILKEKERYTGQQRDYVLAMEDNLARAADSLPEAPRLAEEEIDLGWRLAVQVISLFPGRSPGKTPTPTLPPTPTPSP